MDNYTIKNPNRSIDGLNISSKQERVNSCDEVLEESNIGVYIKKHNTP